MKYTLTVNTKNSTKKTDAVLEVEYTDAFGNSLLEKSVVTEKLENTWHLAAYPALDPASQAEKGAGHPAQQRRRHPVGRRGGAGSGRPGRGLIRFHRIGEISDKLCKENPPRPCDNKLVTR